MVFAWMSVNWRAVGVYALPVVVLVWMAAATRSRPWRRKYAWWDDRNDHRMRL
jgi:hypothetical protein